jgi:putative MATE family efflux protein
MSPTTLKEKSGLFHAIKSAIVGDPHRDFTQGSIGRAIAMLAVPMVLEMMMESLFEVVDMFWVAHLGANAVATVGFTESLLILLFAVALGLSIATTATVARRIGEKDPKAAADTASQAVLLGVGIAVVTGTWDSFFARDLLRIMGASPEVIALGSGYTRAIYGGSGTVLLLFLINGVFRGAGDASLAMRVLWTANWINIVLNPLLIFGLGPFPAMGITGAAIGTTVGRTVGVLYQLTCLASGRGRVQLRRRHLRFDPALARHLLRVSLGGIVQFLIATASSGSSWMCAVFGAQPSQDTRSRCRIISRCCRLGCQRRGAGGAEPGSAKPTARLSARDSV